MNIKDPILQAIDTVVSQRLSKLQFDNTVTCKIVDNSRREIGEYTVEYANKTKFYAYADIKDYSNDTMVYVSIPNGDWSAEKRIVGRQNASNLSPAVQYIHPMDTIAIYGADGYGDTAIISAEVSTTPAKDDKPYTYTLEVPYHYETADGRIDGVAHLTSANVLGNPCDLPVPQKISVRIQAPKGSTVIVDTPPNRWEGLVEKGGGEVVWTNQEVIYGFDLDSRINETVEIATTSKLTIPANVDLTTFAPVLKALWINKNTNNTYIGFEEGHFKDKTAAKTIMSADRPDADIIYYWLQWFQKDYGEEEWREVSTEWNDDNTYTWRPTEIKPTTQFKACIYKNGAVFTSNIITFMSQEHKITLENPPLSITIEGEKDYFDIYDANGSTTSTGPYNFRVQYNGWSQDKIEELKLNTKQVHWSIKSPGNSMIASVDSLGQVWIKEQYNITTNEDNIIVAQVNIGGQLYTAEKVLRFAMMENGGNGYYLYIDRDKQYDFEFGTKTGELKYILYKDGEKILQDSELLGDEEYSTLKKTITVKIDDNIVTRKTIPLAIGTSGYRYVGPTSVAYDSFGTRVRGQNFYYECYNGDTSVTNAKFTLAQNNINWSISEKDKRLNPPDIFVEGNDACLTITSNGKEIWKQGIVIFPMRYSSQFINDWDGGVVIDKNKKSIMSAMIGAGSKNSAGAFTGVFMGDVLNVRDDYAKVASGLLGYKDGVQTFGLNTDGSAFIKSPSGAGGIYLNAAPEGNGRGYYLSVTDALNEKCFKINSNMDLIMRGGVITTKKQGGKNGLTISLDDGIITSGKNVTIMNEGDTPMCMSVDVSEIRMGQEDFVNGQAINFLSIMQNQGVSLQSKDYGASVISGEDQPTIQLVCIQRSLLRNLPAGINIRNAPKTSASSSVLTTTQRVPLAQIGEDGFQPISFFFPVANDVDANVADINNFYPIYVQDNNLPFTSLEDLKAYIETKKSIPKIAYIYQFGGGNSTKLFTDNVKESAPNYNRRVTINSSDGAERLYTVYTGSTMKLVPNGSYILIAGPEGQYIKIGGDNAIAVYKDGKLTTSTYTLPWN